MKQGKRDGRRSLSSLCNPADLWRHTDTVHTHNRQQTDALHLYPYKQHPQYHATHTYHNKTNTTKYAYSTYTLSPKYHTNIYHNMYNAHCTYHINHISHSLILYHICCIPNMHRLCTPYKHICHTNTHINLSHRATHTDHIYTYTTLITSTQHI